jgi:hypothetical protein
MFIRNADNPNKICNFIFKYINIKVWVLTGEDIVDILHIREQNIA